MNTYTVHFTRHCPRNNLAILYTLVIENEHQVMVEKIMRSVRRLPHYGYHEDIADTLVASLPGLHTLSAHHHGVDIVTRRGRA